MRQPPLRWRLKARTGLWKELSSADMIATSRQSANRTIVPSIRESLGNASPARAGLRRAARVHFHQHSPSAFCLVREHLKKAVPSDIVHGLRQHAAGEPLHVQIFDGNHAVLVHHLARQLMLEVAALVRHMRVGALKPDCSAGSCAVPPSVAHSETAPWHPDSAGDSESPRYSRGRRSCSIPRRF